MGTDNRAAEMPVLRAQYIGWDGGGDFMMAAVRPHGDSDYLYCEAVSRFKTKAQAEAVCEALSALRRAVDDRRTVPTTGVESAALRVLEAFNV